MADRYALRKPSRRLRSEQKVGWLEVQGKLPKIITTKDVK
jgi:hypothetical protein